MLLLAYFYPFLFFPFLITAQSPISTRFLDSILQDYAFRSFFRPKTGIVYDGNVPSNLTGITVSALRLRSGSLRRRGLNNYKEFDLPSGILENPYVERLVLVYQNLGNLSEVYYPLSGYTYLTPVVGLLAYNGTVLSDTGLPELDFRPSENPILIRFKNVGFSPNGSNPKCVFFDLFGSLEFDNVVNGSVCSSKKQGHFGLVVEGTTSSPSPAPAIENPLPTALVGGGGGGWRKWWLICGSLVGGVVAVMVVVLAVVILSVRRCRGRKRIGRMEVAAEGGVPLGMTAVGNAKVPVAMGTRTRPVLEDEYVS